MMGIKEIAERKATEERCRKIGEMTIGLYFLAGQARAAGLGDVAKTIDAALARVVRAGREAYESHLRGAIQSNATSDAAFIELFCPADDDAVKLELREIADRELQGKDLPSSGRYAEAMTAA
jgi:hypothetical protein